MYAHSFGVATLVPNQTKFGAESIVMAIGIVVDIAVVDAAMQAKHVPLGGFADIVAAAAAVEAKLILVEYSLEDAWEWTSVQVYLPSLLGYQYLARLVSSARHVTVQVNVSLWAFEIEIENV